MDGPKPQAPQRGLYDATYYGHHCGGIAYERSPHWLTFFGRVADRIVAEFEPTTVLDVGCAHGFLVEALRDRGVDARGVDISEYAISQVREDVRPYCSVASVLLPLPGEHYDLVTCVEVLEHLPEEDALGAVQNLCTVADDVLFTSSPIDFREETHLNVRPAEYWAGLFARAGFLRDVDFDGSFLTWWAMRFRRSHEPVPRIVAAYERELWRLKQENRERHAVVIEQFNKLKDLESPLRSQLALEGEIDRLNNALSESHHQIVQMSQDLHRLRAIEGSASLRLAGRLRHAALTLAPHGTLRNRVLRDGGKGVRALRSGGPRGVLEGLRRRRARTNETPGDGMDPYYASWIEAHEPDAASLEMMRSEAAAWDDAPRISVILPVYSPERSWLEEAIASVRDQAYPKWELCVADDASPKPHVREVLDRIAGSDPRVKVIYRTHNGGISAATNTALELATGEFVLFLDHDDVLRPHAMFLAVSYIRDHPGTDIVYSDEDLILVNGQRGRPFFKPDWSPAWLLSQNYITHIAVVRRSLVEKVGGLRSEFDGAQDHDLLLRVTELTDRVGHVNDILYSWRQVPGSAALNMDEKPTAWEAGRRAIADACTRRGLNARVVLGPQPGISDVRFEINDNPRLTIVIPTRDRLDLLARCIDSVVTRSTYTNYEIVLVDNDSREQRTLEFLRKAPHRVVAAPGPFNYPRLVNLGVRSSDAQYIVLLNNDTFVLTEDWLERMLGLCQQPDVGAVGCRLQFGNGGLQHAGVGLGYGQLAYNLHTDWFVDRDVSAVTGACIMVRRDVFDAVDGFDERLAVGFNDVDFCLRVRELGLRVVYTPHARLEHEEGSSRSHLAPLDDINLFRTRWGDEQSLRDPYLNPNVMWPERDRLRIEPYPGASAQPPWLIRTGRPMGAAAPTRRKAAAATSGA